MIAHDPYPGMSARSTSGRWGILESLKDDLSKAKDDTMQHSQHSLHVQPADFDGDGNIVSVRRITEPHGDINGKLVGFRKREFRVKVVEQDLDDICFLCDVDRVEKRGLGAFKGKCR